MVVLVVFAALTTMVALRMPYPSTFDELPHVSVVRAQYEHPAPFADASTYRMVSRDDLARWTTASNYINHPPLYYMMIGQMLRVTSDVYALRLANVVLALVALAIGLWAGVRYLGAGGDRTVFVILIACFPKAPLIGGIVNNDNLANIAAVIVFVGLTGAGGGAWLLGIGLALAGWTKLTALVSLGTAVIIARGWPLMRGRRAWRFADLWPIALGGALERCHTWPIMRAPAICFTSTRRCMAFRWPTGRKSTSRIMRCSSLPRSPTNGRLRNFSCPSSFPRYWRWHRLRWRRWGVEQTGVSVRSAGLFSPRLG